MLLQQVQYLRQVLAGQQLGGVGRCRTSHQQVQILVDTGRNNLVEDVALFQHVLVQQDRDTLLTVFDAEEFTQGRLTDIQTAKNHFLA